MRSASLFLVAVSLISSPSDSKAAECDGAASHPEWAFCHDFEVEDADDFNKYWNDTYGAPERVFILAENPPGIAGGRCMRTKTENTTSEALQTGITSGPKKFLGKVVSWDALYYRKYIRFNKDFKQGNFMHLGGMGACAPNLYPWDCMGGAGSKPTGADRFSSNLEPWSDYQKLPWPGRWGFYSYYHQMYKDCGHPGPDDCYGDMFSPDTDVFISLGDWHALEMMIQPNTPNVDDGHQTFWIDGKKIYTADKINWRTSADLRLNKIGVYQYIHNVPANTTNLVDFDNVIISTAYIGPAPCTDGAAIGAPCLCGGAPDPESDSNVHADGFCCGGAWQSSACGATSDESGVSDSGPTDGATDGTGLVDSGAPTEAGSGASLTDGGCGCGVSPSPSTTVFLLAFAGLLYRRRRR